MIIAVDPGKSGGIAVLNGNGDVFAHPMPDTEVDTINLLKDYVRNFDEHVSKGIEHERNICAYIEKVQGFIGFTKKAEKRFCPHCKKWYTEMASVANPASTMFTFGFNAAIPEITLLCLGIPVKKVPPQNWQKALMCGSSRSHKDKPAWKRHLRGMAQKAFPKLPKITLKTADALLILDFARKVGNQI